MGRGQDRLSERMRPPLGRSSLCCELHSCETTSVMMTDDVDMSRWTDTAGVIG